MANKVTLITPPDIFENSNKSILVIDLDQAEQDSFSEILGKYEGEFNINIYYYQGEPDIPWLLHAVARSDFVYINLDNYTDISHLLASYIASKPNVWITTKNIDMKALFSYFNQRFVENIDEFLNKALNET